MKPAADHRSYLNCMANPRLAPRGRRVCWCETLFPKPVDAVTPNLNTVSAGVSSDSLDDGRGEAPAGWKAEPLRAQRWSLSSVEEGRLGPNRPSQAGGPDGAGMMTTAKKNSRPVEGAIEWGKRT